jgi:hypothetical protein
MTFEGNVWFNNGTIDPTVGGRPEMFIGAQGGSTVPVSGITFNQNYTYRVDGGMTADLGYTPQQVNQDVVFTNNYLVGQLQILQWVTATVSGNTVSNPGLMVANWGNVAGHNWNGNTFYGAASASAWTYNSTTTTFGSWKTLTGLTNPGAYAAGAPTGVTIGIRPNQYEPGRANIVVYNWAQQSTVSADVSAILAVGDRYVVKSVQDFYGTPVASGTYTGTPLQLPMASTPAPTPIGRGVPGPTTGPTFNVFVLLKTP